MIRLVFIVACVALGAYALMRIVKAARAGEWDWQGVGLALLFVIVAIWLRNETGVGGIFD
jgi:hypothetical protein